MLRNPSIGQLMPYLEKLAALPQKRQLWNYS